jgi:carbonic anhydrase
MSLGSIVYGVEILGAPLILVLGHARCGAVDAAVRIVNENARFRGALGHLLLPLVPSVLKAKATNPKDLVAASVRENVHAVMEALHYSEPSISERLQDGRLKIVGAYYDLVSGEVDFFV